MNIMISLRLRGSDDPDRRSGVTEGATIIMTLIFVSLIEAVTARKVEEDLQTSKSKLN